MNLIKYLSSFNIAKLIITLVCLVFFVIQSHNEIENFVSNLTSVSTQHRRDVKIRMPRVLICLDDPYKSEKYPDTIEEYYKSIYSKDEIIGLLAPNESESSPGVQVTELTTQYYGSCYMLTLPEESWIMIGFNVAKDVILYFVDHGQELCIFSSVTFCDVPIQGMVLKQFVSEGMVRATKIVEER